MKNNYHYFMTCKHDFYYWTMNYWVCHKCQYAITQPSEARAFEWYAKELRDLDMRHDLI